TALLVATLDSIGVKFHGARHENNACAMAEGYASATGRLGVAVLGRGPATANALHGATYASRSGSRVLIICGDTPHGVPPANALGPDTKFLASAQVLQAAGIRTYVATHAATARQTLAQAVDATRHGAVALLLPTNVQFGPIDPVATAPIPLAVAKASNRPVRAAAVQTAAALLEKSRRPVIVAGVGAHRAGARDALVALADHLGAALATTLKTKDMFRGHP